MVRLGVYGQGLTMPLILEDGTMDAERYINEALPVPLKSGDKMFGNNWTCQQDGARPHIHSLSKKLCVNHFSPFIPANRWPPNSLDLYQLNYSIRLSRKFVQLSLYCMQ
mgnify:CR=1 FL=1